MHVSLCRVVLLLSFLGLGMLSAEEVAPKPITWMMPPYPFDLFHKKVGGRAVVEFVVQTDGTVKDGKIVEESHKLFGKSAREIVKQWRLRSAKRDGAPIPWTLRVPFVFDPVAAEAMRGAMNLPGGQKLPPTGAIDDPNSGGPASRTEAVGYSG
jgi:TonB family protein